MSPRRSASTLAAAAAVASLAAAPAALARGPVFGGATRAGEAIVLRTDAKAKRLKSAVLAWSAECKGGGFWTDSSEVAAAAAQPGFAPDPGELVVGRNRGGRFSGTQAYASSAGELTGLVTVQLAGKMTGKGAKGTLHANVALVDDAGEVKDGCDSGTVRWTATHAPGRVFGGKTSQERPVVLRLDARRRTVSNLMIGWGTRSCVPDGYMAIGESFGNFTIKAHRFGDGFSEDYALDDGSKRTFAYEVAGTVRRSQARGTFSVTVDQRDPAGTQTLSCESGPVSWSALTG